VHIRAVQMGGLQKKKRNANENRCGVACSGLRKLNVDQSTLGKGRKNFKKDLGREGYYRMQTYLRTVI